MIRGSTRRTGDFATGLWSGSSRRPEQRIDARTASHTRFFHHVSNGPRAFHRYL